MSDRDYRFFQNQISGKESEIYDYVPVIGGTGDFIRLSGINVIINSLRNLLMTPRGHYPFDPEFGSDLYKKLFEMSDEITKKEIEYEIKTVITKYDRRIKIVSTILKWSTDKKTIQINVKISRDNLTGTINAVLSQQHNMFGIEDEITEAAL